MENQMLCMFLDKLIFSCFFSGVDLLSVVRETCTRLVFISKQLVQAVKTCTSKKNRPQPIKRKIFKLEIQIWQNQTKSRLQFL